MNHTCKHIIFLCNIIFVQVIGAQNLVRNFSFDDYVIPDSGVYETYPSSIKGWNGYRYMNQPGKSYSYLAPIYNNRQHIIEPSINGFRYRDLTSFEKGDSSYVIFSPLGFMGDVGIICGELESCTRKGVEYELSFDYEIIKEQSDFSLAYIYCALSNDYGYVTTDRGVRWFHYNSPKTIDLVKVELRTDTLGRHRAHAKFVSNGGADYITIGYLPGLESLDKLRVDIRKLGNRIKGQDLAKLETPIPVHYIKNDSNRKIHNIELSSFNVHYLIDNVCISPLDSSVCHERISEVEKDCPDMALGDEIEYNLRRQIHDLNINKQVYEFIPYGDSLSVESDTLLFDTDRYFRNFVNNETIDIDDSLQYVIASRTLRQSYHEPTCESDSDYFRVASFGADKQYVFRLNGNRLTVKIGEGRFLFTPREVVLDTVIVLSDKDLNKITKKIDAIAFSRLLHTYSTPKIDISGRLSMIVDFRIGDVGNAMSINEMYLDRGYIKHTEYARLYSVINELLKIIKNADIDI